MAINISEITGYVNDNRNELIGKAVLGAKSASLFNTQTGLKGKSNLNLLETTVKLQDGSACGWSEQGTSKVSNRLIDVRPIKVNQSFCDKQLVNTFMSHEVRMKAGFETLPFQEKFADGVVKGVQAEVEKTIWTGKKSAGAQFDGLIEILSGETVGGTYAVQSSDTAAKIINGLYKVIPAAAFSAGEVVMYIGSDLYREYVASLVAEGKLVMTNTVQDVAMPDSMLIAGTNVRLYGVDGLVGTRKAFASYKDNFVFGTDMMDDQETAEMWFDKSDDVFKLKITFSAGVQVAYTDLLAVAK